MERGHDPVKRGISWTGQSTTTHAATILDETGTESWDKEEHNWVKAKPLLISSSGDLVQKTNLGRSASLSEKELKEARTRSQIIAAQLTVPSNCKSRGVQLFNRRRERVNAFTFTSVGGGEEGSHEEPCDELESPSPSTLTWNKECSTESRIKDFKHRRSETQLQRPTTVITSKGHKMEGAVKVANEVGDRVDERHFLPVIDNDKDEEIPEHEEAGKDVTFESDNSPVVPNPNQERQQDVQLTRAYESPLEALKAIQNGNHSTKTSSKEDNSATKQSTITNRTARPFFSPVGVTSTEAIHSPDISLTPAYSTSPPPAQYDPTAATYSKQEPLTFVKPAFSVSSRQVFSPPPPAPSYPTPPLPSYMSLPPSIPTDPPPLSAMSPPPSPAYYTPLTIPSSTYANQLMADRRTVTPNRTGILEEGRGRRSNRKSMFTFQEKPKLSPNPELLSLVQTTDEKKKSRGQETHQEEEQLALGAEASNFLVKDESGVEEALVPEWASTLKSSRTQPRVEHKPEQALSSASGKGAELFAKRQSRMEKYVHENAEGLRSPSPTTSLPPSWVYPSNMPGRVKAIINASNITAEVSKTFQAQRVTQKKNTPAKLPVPPPVQENPTLENGCTRVEMELSRHKPYQINSSLFILNPTKDPKSTLPRAAPPPKPVVMGSSYSRQTSLPSTPIPSQYDSHDYRSAHCFSPPMMPLNSVSRRVTSPMSDAAPERVTSPRSSIQAPKPTFSTKKAGITPQGKEDSLVTSHINSPSSPVPWTPNLFRRHSSTDKSPGAGWTPISQHSSLVTSPPPRTIHIPINSVASSPPAKTIHNSMTCSPISGSIHNPVTSFPTPRSIHNPISPPPNPRHFNSPVTSSANTQSMSSSPSPKPFKSSVAIISLSKPQNIHTATTPVSPPWETRGQSPIPLQDTKANHRLIAKNIINAAKRKNSLSPRALSGHGLLMSPVSSTILPFETKPQSPFQSRALGAQSPTFTSPPVTPTQLVRSPLRLYTSRSLTDSDASLESEDSGMRSPGVRSYNTCPRGWSGSLRLKRGAMSEDL